MLFGPRPRRSGEKRFGAGVGTSECAATLVRVAVTLLRAASTLLKVAVTLVRVSATLVRLAVTLLRVAVTSVGVSVTPLRVAATLLRVSVTSVRVVPTLLRPRLTLVGVRRPSATPTRRRPAVCAVDNVIDHGVTEVGGQRAAGKSGSPTVEQRSCTSGVYTI